ncbi:MAG: cell division protein ZapA [Cocleimonas sp.]
MSNNETIPVTIRILEKEYKISCPKGEHESLLVSAKNVNDNMTKVREGGKALSADRVAVMAAINIAHDLVKVNEQPNINNNLVARIDEMQKSIDSVLKQAI